MTTQRVKDVPCTVTVIHTWETLEAHVELDGGEDLAIGDRVLVHGDAVRLPPFGEKLVVRRWATVSQAGFLEKIWIRIQSFFELTELFEVSFSEGIFE
ncbi:MAG: hypothetical protein AAFY34_12895 [Pseudomonadota bacterium]